MAKRTDLLKEIRNAVDELTDTVASGDDTPENLRAHAAEDLRSTARALAHHGQTLTPDSPPMIEKTYAKGNGKPAGTVRLWALGDFDSFAAPGDVYLDGAGLVRHDSFGGASYWHHSGVEDAETWRWIATEMGATGPPYESEDGETITSSK